MTPRARNTLLGVAFAIILVSDLMLIRSNMRLRDELNVANGAMGTLRKNAFHNNAGVGDSSPSPELFLYNNRQTADAFSDNRDQSYSIKPISLDSTAGVPLLDLKTKYVGTAAGSEFVLFVFFSPTDCPACLSEADLWQKMHADSQRLGLSVIGVMNHPDKTEGEQFLKQLGITFPVFFDSTAFLKKRYRIGETPEKVLMDSQGKTLLISPGSRTQEQRVIFEESVLKLIAGKSPQ